MSFRIWKRHKTQSIIATFFKAVGGSEEQGNRSTAVPEASHTNYDFPPSLEARREDSFLNPLSEAFLRQAHMLVLEGTFLVME